MDHIFTEKYPKMLYNNIHLKLLIMTIVTEGLEGNPGAWTYLAWITLMKHFEQIRGALVPLQSKNQDCNHTKRKSQSAPTLTDGTKTLSSYLCRTFEQILNLKNRYL